MYRSCTKHCQACSGDVLRPNGTSGVTSLAAARRRLSRGPHRRRSSSGGPQREQRKQRHQVPAVQRQGVAAEEAGLARVGGCGCWVRNTMVQPPSSQKARAARLLPAGGGRGDHAARRVRRQHNAKHWERRTRQVLLPLLPRLCSGGGCSSGGVLPGPNPSVPTARPGSETGPRGGGACGCSCCGALPCGPGGGNPTAGAARPAASQPHC